MRWSSGTLPTDFTYTGQRDVPGTGLVFMRARYYQPGLGRFVSADTIVPNPANPQDFNRYSYGANSPLVYNDPTGHMHWPGGGGEARPWEHRAGPEQVWDPQVVSYVEQNVHEPTAEEWVVLAGIGMAPLVCVAAPAYALAGVASEAGYVGGALLTGAEIDPLDATLAFYVGGIQPSSGMLPSAALGRVAANAAWAGGNNLTQYMASSVIRGERLTLAAAGSTAGLGFASGFIGSAFDESIQPLSLNGQLRGIPLAQKAMAGAMVGAGVVIDVGVEVSAHTLTDGPLTVDRSIDMRGSSASLGSTSSAIPKSADVFPWLQ